MRSDEKDFEVVVCNSQDDAPAAREVCRRLGEAGVRTWNYEVSISAGSAWEDAIREALRSRPLALFLLSDGSMGRTGYFQKEILEALEIQKQKPPGSIFMIPVRLENC